jgi:hypothetical protein
LRFAEAAEIRASLLTYAPRSDEPFAATVA